MVAGRQRRLQQIAAEELVNQQRGDVALPCRRIARRPLAGRCQRPGLAQRALNLIGIELIVDTRPAAEALISDYAILPLCPCFARRVKRPSLGHSPGAPGLTPLLRLKCEVPIDRAMADLPAN